MLASGSTWRAGRGRGRTEPVLRRARRPRPRNRRVALIVATHGALVLPEMVARNRAGHLAKALESNRDIGTAMGVLMHQHRFTRQEAFDVLSVASENSNRKLAELALEATGTLRIHQR